MMSWSIWWPLHPKTRSQRFALSKDPHISIHSLFDGFAFYSGPVEQLPTTETEPYHSIGGYGKNKIRCEEILWDAFNNDQFPVTIMRPSHSYGEGGDIIRCFGSNASFVDRLRTGKPVIIPGDGTNLWASCHVDDVARGFSGVMQKRKVHRPSL